MLTTSVAASGLVYWGVAANVVIEQGDNLTATFEQPMRIGAVRINGGIVSCALT
jgi:hypothetical protein